MSITKLPLRLILIAITVLIYALHVRNGFVDLDDLRFIVENPLVKSGNLFGGFFEYTNLLYIPLTVFTWVLTGLIFGVNAWAFHSIDLAIHVINVLCVFWILQKLCGKQWLAFFAALIFAVHPLNAEVVFWASQRKDILAACFSFLSIALYIRYLDEHRRALFLWSALFFIFALFSKVSTAPVPLIFLLLDWVSDRGSLRSQLVEKLPLIIISVGMLIVGSLGAEQFLAPIGLGTMFLLACKSLAYLCLNFVLPLRQNVLLYQAGEVSILQLEFLLSIGFFVLFIATTAFSIWKKQKMLAFGLLWFLLFLAPTFTAAQKAGLLFYSSEKYTYLPMVGLLIAVMVLADELLSRFPGTQKFLLGLSVIVAALFGYQAFQYGFAWKNGVTLYQHVLAVDAENPIALSSLGYIAGQKQDWSPAINFYSRSIEADPDNLIPYLNLAGAYHSTGKDEEMVKTLETMHEHMSARQLRGDPQVRKLILFVTKDVLSIYEPELGQKILQKAKDLDHHSSELR